MQLKAQDFFEELSYPYAMKKVELDTSKIAYADEGQGEVILFVHGLASYAPAWKKNIEYLKENYRCIAVDLVGYGKSSKGKFQADMTFHAENLFRLMEELEIKKFHIAGHSMGSQIAIHMALSDPEKVESLILISPAGIETFSDQEKQFFMMTTPEQIAAVSDAQYRKNLEINFYKMPEDAEFMYTDRMSIKNDPHFMDYCHVVVEGIKGMLNEPVFKNLNQLLMPVVVFYGKEDYLIPNRYLHPKSTVEDIAKLAEENIPNAEIRLIPGAGHFLHFEKPEVVNIHINEFIESIPN